MMVSQLEQQHDVMVEFVQNHSPRVMIIDEIGRTKEALAAQTCRSRGVRLIASVHGDLRSLVDNRMLNDLVGGVQDVTIGDAQAKESASKSKIKLQRKFAPSFEMVVEVDYFNKFRVIIDVAEAVDSILNGETFVAQLRSRTQGQQMELDFIEL
jgi:stage III sporulation protein SpoIIIAA